MSRKDYAKIAEVFKEVRLRIKNREENRKEDTSGAYREDVGSLIAWEDCLKGVADALSEDNPRFDYNRFYKAAGYERK